MVKRKIYCFCCVLVIGIIVTKIIMSKYGFLKTHSDIYIYPLLFDGENLHLGMTKNEIEERYHQSLIEKGEYNDMGIGMVLPKLSPEIVLGLKTNEMLRVIFQKYDMTRTGDWYFYFKADEKSVLRVCQDYYCADGCLYEK